MKREEAIATLEDIIETYRNDKEYKDWVEACSYAINLIIDMAIAELSQPIVCKDYCIDDDHIYCSPKVAERVVEALKDRPQGEWISNRSGYWKCSECGIRVAIYGKGNYCPNCGADMRGDAE